MTDLLFVLGMWITIFAALYVAAAILVFVGLFIRDCLTGNF